MAARRALVTGANKGIGLAIVRGLARAGFDVVLSARDAARGAAAQQLLQAEGLPVAFVQLDVTDTASVQAAAAAMAARGGLDVLVCNAGVAAKGKEVSTQIALDTLAANYFGVQRCLDAFTRPSGALRAGARVVVVGSRMGDYGKLTPAKEALFRRAVLPVPELDALVRAFAADVGDQARAADWMPAPNTYAFSKIAVNALVGQYAQSAPADVTIVNMCPGWVRTDMGGEKAPGTAEDGADTALWLATTAEPLRRGLFYADRAVVDKFSPAFLL